MIGIIIINNNTSNNKPQSSFLKKHFTILNSKGIGYSRFKWWNYSNEKLRGTLLKDILLGVKETPAPAY